MIMCMLMDLFFKYPANLKAVAIWREAY